MLPYEPSSAKCFVHFFYRRSTVLLRIIFDLSDAELSLTVYWWCILARSLVCTNSQVSKENWGMLLPLFVEYDGWLFQCRLLWQIHRVLLVLVRVPLTVYHIRKRVFRRRSWTWHAGYDFARFFFPLGHSGRSVELQNRLGPRCPPANSTTNTGALTMILTGPFFGSSSRRSLGQPGCTPVLCMAVVVPSIRSITCCCCALYVA